MPLDGSIVDDFTNRTVINIKKYGIILLVTQMHENSKKYTYKLNCDAVINVCVLFIIE